MKTILALAIVTLTLFVSCQDVPKDQALPCSAASEQLQISQVLARPKVCEQACFFIHAGQGEQYKDCIKVPITGVFQEYLLKLNEQDLLPPFSHQYAILADPWLYTIQIGEKYYSWSGLNHIRIVGRSQGQDKCYAVPYLAIRGDHRHGTPAAMFKTFGKYQADPTSPQSRVALKRAYQEFNQYLNAIYSASK